MNMNDTTAKNILLDDLSIELQIAKNCIAILTVSEIPPDEKELRDNIKNIKPFFSAVRSDKEIDNLKNNLVKESHKERLDAVLAVIDALIRPKRISWTKVLTIVESKWPSWGTPWLIAGKDAIIWKRLSLAKDRLQRAHNNLPVGHYGLISALDHLRIEARKSENYDLELLSNQFLAQHRPDSTNCYRWAESALKLKDWLSFDKAIKYFFVGNDCELFENKLDNLTGIIRSENNSNSTTQVIINCFGLDVNEGLEEINKLRYDQLSSFGNILSFVNIWASKNRKLNHDYRAWSQISTNIYIQSLKICNGDNNIPKEQYLLRRIGENFAQTLRFLPSHSSEDAIYIREQAEKIINYMGLTYKDSAYTAQRHLAAIYTGEAKRAIDIGLTGHNLKEIINRADTAYKNWYEHSYRAKRQLAAKKHFEFRMLVKYFDGITEIAKQAGHKFPPLLEEILQFGLSKIEEESISLLNLKKEFSDEAMLLFIKTIKSEYETFKEIKVDTKYKINITSKKLIMAKKLIDKLHDSTCWITNICKTEIKKDNLIKARNLLEALKIIKEIEWNIEDLDTELSLILAEYHQNTCTKEYLENFVEIILANETWSKNKILLRRIVEVIDSANLVLDLPIDKICSLIICNNNMELRNYNMIISFSNLLIRQSRTEDHVKFLSEFFKHTDQNGISKFLPDLIETLPFDILLSSVLKNQLLKDKIDILLQENKQVILSIVNSLVKGVLAVWNKSWNCRKRLIKSIVWIKKSLSDGQQALAWAQLFGAERSSTVRIAIRQRKQEVHNLEKELYRSSNKMEWFNYLDRFLKGKTSKYNLNFPDKEDIKIMFDYAISSMINFDPINRDREYWCNMTDYSKKIISDMNVKNKIIAIIWLNLQTILIKALLIRFCEAGNYSFHTLKNIIKNYPEDIILTKHIKDDLQRTVKDTLHYLDWQHWPVLESGINLKLLVEEIAYQPPYTLTYNNSTQNVPLIYPILPVEPIFLCGNILMLKEMFKTLLTNAIEHTAPASKGGWIRLEISTEQSNAHIIITDNGEGINLDILRVLNNVDGDFRTTKKMGTGYGIRFSQRCTKLHRGEMQITSEILGAGTRIDIWLPLERKLT